MNEDNSTPNKNNPEEIEAVATDISEMLQMAEDNIDFLPGRTTIITRAQFDD
ncbi:hypothetical protein [Pseudomonas fluorescens]|uniref:hypothetical protein n=1 Tax=Pseudomonas fluorescens TaxID=294 RepID=UPI000AF539C5|nr:hypothetical protein [Pseudomonas fluorescens]